MKFISLLALFLTSLSARADVVADGVTGLSGNLSSAKDCYSINFPSNRDSEFFKQFCLGAVITTNLLKEVSGATIHPASLQGWILQNNLSAWVMNNVMGITSDDMPAAIARAKSIISVIHGGDFSQSVDEQNSAWIYYTPYPSLKDKCLSQGNDRFHGAVLIDFKFDSASNAWETSEISNAVNCRKT